MKNILLTIMLMLGLSAQAQTLRDFFVEKPDSLMPLLTAVNRADFGDFLDSKMKAVVKNRFDSHSEMKKMTEDYLYLEMTKVSSVEMKMLPLSDSINVICVVKTFSSPAQDSQVLFYDTQWNQLKTDDFIELPREAEYFIEPVTQEGIDSLQNLRRTAGMFLQKASLDEKKNAISLGYTSIDYMDEKSAKELKPFLQTTLIHYEWADGRFRRK